MTVFAGASCGHGRLAPGANAQLVPEVATAAVAVDSGVRVVASLGDAGGVPKELPDQVAPIKIRVVNHGTRPVSILYERFSLEGKRGRRYHVVPGEHADPRRQPRVAAERGHRRLDQDPAAGGVTVRRALLLVTAGALAFAATARAEGPKWHLDIDPNLYVNSLDTMVTYDDQLNQRDYDDGYSPDAYRSFEAALAPGRASPPPPVRPRRSDAATTRPGSPCRGSIVRAARWGPRQACPGWHTTC